MIQENLLEFKGKKEDGRKPDTSHNRPVSATPPIRRLGLRKTAVGA